MASSASSSSYSATPSPAPPSSELEKPTLNGAAHPDFPPLSSPPLSDSPLPPTSSTSAIKPAPTLAPSTTDLLVIGVYPATLLLASIVSMLGAEPSYFSQKHNLFNVVFVKYGWFWTTLAFLFHLSRLRASSKPKALLRYTLATAWWVLVTQWCFGPPIMDRGFTLTGGKCAVLSASENPREELGMGRGQVLLTSAACKLAGGRWEGGHDLSGHVFMLTHASMFLWAEIGPVLALGMGGGETLAVLAVLAMWWWMLLMTGIYFHTLAEKVTGYVFAVAEWAAVYWWAIRTKPEVRNALGVPSV